MKVIFLDIDGVLNSIGYFLRYYENRDKYFRERDQDPFNAMFDPDCVNNLEYILNHVPDLKIVISSAWRLTCNNKQIGEYIKNNGVNFDPDRIVDKTSVSTSREEEIREWIQKYKPNEWFCLDDDRVFKESELNFLKTNRYNGLTFHDSILVIKHFNPYFKHKTILL